MVVTHLTRSMELNLPIVYHRNHWFPEKNAFADSITQRWQLSVHDWPPSECGIKVRDDFHGEPGTAGTTEQGCIQTVNRYQIGPGIGMDVPNGILPPKEGEPWLCALYDILDRPKGGFTHPWDVCLSGHKSSDEDIFEGPCPLRTDFYQIKNGPAIAFPLKEWNNSDVWSYIQEFAVPIQENRYDLSNKTEFTDKRFNNDYVRACTLCVDRRQPVEVLCPKTNQLVKNIGPSVEIARQTEIEYIAR